MLLQEGGQCLSLHRKPKVGEREGSQELRKKGGCQAQRLLSLCPDPSLSDSVGRMSGSASQNLPFLYVVFKGKERLRYRDPLGWFRSVWAALNP